MQVTHIRDVGARARPKDQSTIGLVVCAIVGSASVRGRRACHRRWRCKRRAGVPEALRGTEITAQFERTRANDRAICLRRLSMSEGCFITTKFHTFKNPAGSTARAALRITRVGRRVGAPPWACPWARRRPRPWRSRLCVRDACSQHGWLVGG